MQVALGITNKYAGCVDSAREGLLTTLRFKLSPFGITQGSSLTFSDGNIKLGARIASSDSTVSSYLFNITDVGFELSSPISWMQEPTRRLLRDGGQFLQSCRWVAYGL